jgi:hypothetical protein
VVVVAVLLAAMVQEVMAVQAETDLHHPLQVLPLPMQAAVVAVYPMQELLEQVVQAVVGQVRKKTQHLQLMELLIAVAAVVELLVYMHQAQAVQVLFILNTQIHAQSA